MDITIGIQNIGREITIPSDEKPEAVAKAVREALAGKPTLELTDERGGLTIIPTASIGFVEIGSPASRPVGFGTL